MATSFILFSGFSEILIFYSHHCLQFLILPCANVNLKTDNLETSNCTKYIIIWLSTISIVDSKQTVLINKAVFFFFYMSSFNKSLAFSSKILSKKAVSNKYTNTLTFFSAKYPKAPMSVNKWVVAKDTTDNNLSGSSAIDNILKLEVREILTVWYSLLFFDNLRSVKCTEFFFFSRLFSIAMAESKFKIV